MHPIGWLRQCQTALSRLYRWKPATYYESRDSVQVNIQTTSVQTRIETLTRRTEFHDQCIPINCDALYVYQILC